MSAGNEGEGPMTFVTFVRRIILLPSRSQVLLLVQVGVLCLDAGNILSEEAQPLCFFRCVRGNNLKGFLGRCNLES